MRRGPRTGAPAVAWIWPLLLFAAACPGDPNTIDRQLFVDTYVDLRTTALTNPGGQIRPDQRDSVLARRGVTEEQLLEFAEIHGRDIEFMAGVWGEVENRLMPPPETPPVPIP